MNASAALADRLAAEIRSAGPISYSTFIDAALYDDEAGFYARHGEAGRRGDFLTSPEVGPLFGAVVARALDEWWRELGEPAPFRVVECDRSTTCSSSDRRACAVSTRRPARCAASPRCRTTRPRESCSRTSCSTT
jgi:hypothetical protein